SDTIWTAMESVLWKPQPLASEKNNVQAGTGIFELQITICNTPERKERSSSSVNADTSRKTHLLPGIVQGRQVAEGGGSSSVIANTSCETHLLPGIVQGRQVAEGGASSSVIADTSCETHLLPGIVQGRQVA
ncbi:hypothetical protein ACJJTC_009960, partial [Scirpophaga incertulas]